MRKFFVLSVCFLLVGCSVNKLPDESTDSVVETKEVERVFRKEKFVEPEIPELPKPPKITWGEETTYRDVDYEVETTNDSDMPKGQERVDVEGVKGQDEVFSIIRYGNGEEISRTDEVKRVKEPVNKKITIGTYVKPEPVIEKSNSTGNGNTSAPNKTTPSKPAQTAPKPVPAATASGEIRVMLNEINTSRASAGLSQLSYSSELARGAGIRAGELITSFSHTRPNGSNFWTVSDLAQGENVSYGYTGGYAAHQGFMDSPGHRDNILTARWNTVGIGLVIDGGTSYWAVLFGH